VDTTTSDQVYTLFFVVCRGVGAGDGELTFDRKQQVDFSAVEDATDDAVWTYSAGQPVVSKPETVAVPAGQCVLWHTDWDGYDDFGRTPAPGQYTLHARSLGDDALQPQTFVFTHQ
jgi:hypothetical protein